MDMSIKARKEILRKEITEKILKLSKEEKSAQTAKVLKKLFALPEFHNSQRISVYLSTDDEINTENIARKIFESNKQCYVPRYNKQVMEMVRLRDMDDWENLPMTKWNIKQPALSEKRENALDTGGLDMIILPGVAFTRDGKRLGHGKGYYDTFQTNIFKLQERRPVRVALAFKEQICDDVPVHEHDVILDQVLYAD